MIDQEFKLADLDINGASVTRHIHKLAWLAANKVIEKTVDNEAHTRKKWRLCYDEDKLGMLVPIPEDTLVEIAIRYSSETT